MSKEILIRCFLVSLVASIVATILTTSVISAPAEGEVVMDLEALDARVLEGDLFAEGDDAEFIEYLDYIPERKVSGFERYTYAFGHPQIWHFFIRGGLSWFIAIFASTLLVSYLNTRDT